MIVLIIAIQQFYSQMSIKQMKTKQQIFKTKVKDLIIKLTNKGNHTAANTLHQTYFLNK